VWLRRLRYYLTRIYEALSPALEAFGYPPGPRILSSA